MFKLTTIVFLFLHLILCLGDMVSFSWMDKKSEYPHAQKGAMTDDRDDQESQESKEVINEYCPKSNLLITAPHWVNSSSQPYIDLDVSWLFQADGDIQTPPPDCNC